MLSIKAMSLLSVNTTSERKLPIKITLKLHVFNIQVTTFYHCAVKTVTMNIQVMTRMTMNMITNPRMMETLH